MNRIQSFVAALTLAAVVLISTGATDTNARFGRPICTDGSFGVPICPIFPPIR